MYIAMNRFRVRRGCEADFEAVWLNRDVFINREPGFVVFHMLKGPQDDECSLYISHTIWATRQDFENWTRSESFRAAHKSAGGKKPLYLGGPHFEGFDAIQEVKPAAGE